MVSCWSVKPEDRPSFTKLKEVFTEMMNSNDSEYLMMTVDESHDYYAIPSFHSAEDDDEDFEQLQDDKMAHNPLL